MSYNTIITTLENGVRTIQFNRPKQLNALSNSMFSEIITVLSEDAKNDSVVITIFTGAGNYFSSGKDFSEAKIDGDDAKRSSNIKFERFITTLIDYPKLLIAVVNGPAYGVGVTMLAHCDIVYASERASFTTPFVKIGITPEACSTYIFPRILGRSKASEMLLLGEKLTVQEALQRGFIAKIVPHEDLGNFIKRLHKYAQLPVNSLQNTKKLITTSITKHVHETLRRELIQLEESFKSPEFLERKSSILSKRSKL